MQTSDRHEDFDLIFNRYYAGLCVYAESFVGNRQTAEDMVQDVFVSVWMKRGKLTFDDTLSAYLYRSVHNAAVQYLRLQKARGLSNIRLSVKLEEAELIPYEWIAADYDPAEAAEIQKLYRQALEQLPPQTREIFLCSREKDMKYSEIAELTGLSVKSVEYHMSKALDVFRRVLKDYYFLLFIVFTKYSA
jgi:RNA polymerase sigma-70 factor (ECF subfamily)